LSNSGASRELNDLIAYLKRFAIKMIAITADSGSLLGENADLILQLPPQTRTESQPETMSMVPTSSTTAQIALGDALAMALIKMRGFTIDDFSVFHPGGQIGTQLMRVGDLMHRGHEVPLVHEDLPMGEAIIAMASKHFGCIGVVNQQNQFCGMITDGDLRRAMDDRFMHKLCSEVMTTKPYTVTVETLGVEVLRIMNERCISAAFVLQKEQPIGIVHIHDLLRVGMA
ncbi:MAG: CBS domain-containing protein, partial [Pseudomonadota bacterium]